MVQKGRKRAVRAAAFMLSMVLTTFSLASGAAAAERQRELIPMGNTIGIQMNTKGVLVVGLTSVGENAEDISPAGRAGVLPGDVIIKLGSREINSAQDFLAAVAELDEGDISITIKRGEKVAQYAVSPQKNAEGNCQLGLWLRDSVTGIGTVTFYDPETGIYGALGHPISDVDTGVIMPLGSGSIMDSTVVEVHPGKSGTPGELCGSFDNTGSRGSILQNTESGIFGLMQKGLNFDDRQLMPVAGENEIVLGEAKILANVRGKEIREYSIEVERVYRNDASGRSMMITITDPELLELTGGIVQGMSGSPIIQNGKLVGAVTHVLISDPTRGYGISVEHMMETAENRIKLSNAA